MRRLRAILIGVYIACGAFTHSVFARTGEHIIQARGDRDYPPFEFLNATHEPDGFNVGLLKAIANEMNLSVNIQLGDWAVIRDELEQGRIDLITGMYRTPEREEHIDFSIPFYVANYALFYREGEQARSLNDIAGESILVQKADLGHDFLLEHQTTNRLILTSTWPDALAALSQGKGRAAFGPRLQGIMVIKKNRLSNLRYSLESPMQAKYCFAVTNGNTSLLADLNEGLTALKSSGAYDRMYEKWFGVYEQKPLTFSSALSFLAWPCILLGAAIVLLFVWSTTLHRQVAAKTALIQKELQERRMAEEALKKSEKRLAITLDSIGDGVISTDLNGLVERMNPVAEQLTGWSIADARGKPLHEIFLLLDSTTLQPVLMDIQNLSAKNGSRPDSERLLKSKDGIKRQIDDRCTAITDETGAMHGFVLTFRDITEQRHLESQLHQLRRMESLGQLAGGLAHEFNNMLGGIMGAAELLESSMEKRTRAYRYVELIINTARKASELTEKLLTFSYRGRHTAKPFDFHKTIQDCASILASSLDKRISIALELEAQSTVINGDISQIQNMIITLGVQANHAMPEGGTLFISTRDVTLDDLFCEKSPFPLTPGKYVNLRIRDTGTGLSGEQVEHLFEPFHTAGRQDLPDSFGLAAVYAAVRDHHGSIVVYSDEREGTAFNICLPLSSDSIAPETPEENEVLPGAGCILVVDDEESIREIAEYFLVKTGYRVIHAVNGCDGVIKYRQHRPEIDLVLLDMTMPMMNGRDCFFAIREINPEAKIVMVSGFTGQNDIRPLLEKGLSAFIEKPYRQATLSRIIHDVLHRPPT